MMDEENKKQTINKLYQELPDEIFESLTENASQSPLNVRSFILNAIPLGDADEIDQLNKMNVSINLERQILKKAKPHRRKAGLSLKERRKLGFYRLPRVCIKYKDAEPMNKLWESYMYTFLNLENLQGKEWYNPKVGNVWESVSCAIFKADYHGALIKVINSRCPSLVGHSGIIIFDTKFTFKIVGQDNLTRTIPKEPCIFEISLKQYKFKIYGKYFCIRTNERSTKKNKSLFIPTLDK